ncbi:cytokine receptor-like factor 3 isoform X2 [Diabrotica virgifera virgifera]|uniref:Cytokine receptor-like factor 3 isoform X2 n=1 Tax=Diabrotica virgifera virgifera TaxID=50390 RepID=A0A6P7F242_DIAVI|nr:cytokine receptor-like factor 3 isoform X2 [Diabrotica virgifera virgifera]
MNNTEVHDTVQAANIYLSRLKWLNSELDHAMKQILSTFEETEANVSKTFCNFKEAFIEALNKREKILLDKAKKVAELTEKPGAVLVEWKVVVDNEEKVTDIEEFRLQKALGNVHEDKHLVVNFHDAYKGLDCQFLQKDLKVNEQYSFRVCCKFEGTTEWSPWSLPQVGSTSLKPFSWQFSQDYELTNEFKVAKPKKDDVDMLYSEGAQFSAGYAIDFMFLEGHPSDAVVGLVCEGLDELPKNVKQCKEGTFVINRNGKISVDGVEKSTVLPEFHRGSKVTFTCQEVNDKLRINIDSKDRIVTYDWSVSPDIKMYFVAQFSSANWKVMVE